MEAVGSHGQRAAASQQLRSPRDGCSCRPSSPLQRTGPDPPEPRLRGEADREMEVDAVCAKPRGAIGRNLTGMSDQPLPAPGRCPPPTKRLAREGGAHLRNPGLKIYSTLKDC